MKKLLAILLLLPSIVFAWEQRPNFPVENCQVHSPYGFAQTQKQAVPLCREGYLVAYDPTVKIPVYVADEPLLCVARGTGRALEEIDQLHELFDNE